MFQEKLRYMNVLENDQSKKKTEVQLQILGQMMNIPNQFNLSEIDAC